MEYRNGVATSVFLCMLTLASMTHAEADSCIRDTLGAFLKRLQPRPSTLETRFEKLRKKDPRYAWADLVRRSRTLDTIDNFISPATQQLILGAGRAGFARIAVLRDGPKSLVRLLRGSGVLVSDPMESLLNDFEARFRTAIGVLDSAHTVKYGRPLVSSSQEYLALLYKYFQKSVQDLKQAGVELPLDPDAARVSADLIVAHGNGIGPHIVYSLEQSAFTADFLESVPDGSTIDAENAIQAVNSKLEKRLDELPVGFSFRLGDLTGSIRFGNYHFLGSWLDYTAPERQHFIAIAPSRGGMVEAELRVSRETKKKMALRLDQTHQRLDGVFGLQLACNRVFHTCGSYAPVFLIRHGIPLTPGGFLASPTMTFLSLAVQRALRIPYVKSIRAQGFGRKTFAILPLYLAHDGYGAFIEVEVIFFAGGTVAAYLLSDDKEKKRIPLDRKTQLGK